MTSLINTGAKRFDRNFLCTQRKLISLARNVLFYEVMRLWDERKSIKDTHCPRTRRVMGTPDMNATSFLLEETRTPMCQSLW